MVNRACRTPIAEECCCHHRFTPIALWQTRMPEHATRTLNQSPVHTLSHSIESGRVRWRKPLDYTAVAAELGHLKRLVFPAIIALEHLDTAVGLSFSKCTEFSRLGRHIRLVSQ